MSLKFVVLDGKDGSPLFNGKEYGYSFEVFNNQIDAWAELIKRKNSNDSRVAKIEFKIISDSGENE